MSPNVGLTDFIAYNLEISLCVMYRFPLFFFFRCSRDGLKMELLYERVTSTTLRQRKVIHGFLAFVVEGTD